MRRIRAKPTKHCGTQFRSKTEAMYCELFNRYDEPWTYESQRFNLRSGSYLPDFFLPRLDLWVEIKGPPPTKQEMTLCLELSCTVQRPVAIAYGWPPNDAPYNPGLMVVSNCFWYGSCCFRLFEGKLTIYGNYAESFVNTAPHCHSIPEYIIRGIEDKFKKRIRTPKPKKR